VTGRIQRAMGADHPDGSPGEAVVSLYAHRLVPIATDIAPRARDFQ
jgi:error-prone DNA polymerase